MFQNSLLRSDEYYFVIRTPRFVVSESGWTEIENDVVEEHRWWSLEDLRSTDDTVYPPGLVEMIEASLEG